jgi:hypothetical protein
MNSAANCLRDIPGMAVLLQVWPSRSAFNDTSTAPLALLSSTGKEQLDYDADCG